MKTGGVMEGIFSPLWRIPYPLAFPIFYSILFYSILLELYI